MSVTPTTPRTDKLVSTTVVYLIVANEQIYGIISLIIREEHGIQCMPCCSGIISENLPTQV